MKLKRIAPILIVVALFAAGLIPLLALSFYARAGADDFSYAALFVHPTIESGGNIFSILAAAFQTSLYYYETWQGLYSSAFVLSLEPSVFGEGYYWITTWILLAISFLAFFALVWALCKKILKTTSKAWIGIACVTWFFFIQTIPNIYEGLYWFNGAMNYLFFWCLFAFCITAAINYLTKEGRARIGWLILTCVLAFIVAGGNHVSTVGCIVSLFFCALFEAIHHKRAWLFCALFLCVLGLLIVSAAPGTAIRAEALGVDTSSKHAILNNLVQSIGTSGWWLAEHFGGWFSLSTVAYIVCVLPFAVAVTKRAHATFTLHASFWGWLFTAFVAMFWAQLYLLQVSTKGPGAGRVTDILYASFVIMVAAFTVLATYARIQKGGSKLKGINFDTERTSACLLCSAGLLAILFAFNSPLGFTTSTWEYAYTDLSDGSAKSYAEEMDSRLPVLNDASISHVELAPRTAFPPTISTPDFSSDPTYWININAANFYHKDSIVLVDKNVDTEEPTL